MSEQVIKCITCGHSERRLSDGYCDMCERISDMCADYATLQAECETLREQVKALQSAENSYQSGFDAGRAASARFADDWRKECERLRRESENLRARWSEYARELESELAAIKAQEPVAWIVPEFGFLFPTHEAASDYLKNIGDNRNPRPLYTLPVVNPHPTPKK